MPQQQTTTAPAPAGLVDVPLDAGAVPVSAPAPVSANVFTGTSSGRNKLQKVPLTAASTLQTQAQPQQAQPLVDVPLDGGMTPVPGATATAAPPAPSGSASTIPPPAPVTTKSTPQEIQNAANPQHEGTYKMLGADGRTTYQIPFSNVEVAKSVGYKLDPMDTDRYLRDQAGTLPDASGLSGAIVPGGDREIARLTRPTAPEGPEGYDTFADRAGSLVRNTAGGVLAAVLHPVNVVTGMVGQVEDAVDAVDANLHGYHSYDDVDAAIADTKAHPERLGGVNDPKYQKRLAELAIWREGLDKTSHLVTNAVDQMVTDPTAFVGQQLGQLVLAHGVGAAAGPFADALKDKVTSSATEFARGRAGLSDLDVADQVRQAGDTNKQVEHETAEANQETIAKQQAKEAAVAQTAEEKRVAAATKVHDKAAAEAADAQKVIDDATEADRQREALTQEHYQHQAQIQATVPALAKATKQVIDREYGEVREGINQTEAQKESLAQDEYGLGYDELGPEEQQAVAAKVQPPTVPISSLGEAVEKAEKLNGATPELKNRLFAFIKAAQEEVPNENVVETRDFDNNFEADKLARQVPIEAGSGSGQLARGPVQPTYQDFASMPEGAAKQAIREEVLRRQDAYMDARSMDDPDSVRMDWDHLHSLSSNLGKEAFRAYKSGDLTLSKAIGLVKDAADELLMKMADDSGVGPQFRTARKHYSVYRNTFYEPTGPSDSGSPVAQSMLARDSYAASQPFLPEKDISRRGPGGPEARARNMLVGEPDGSTPHYAPEAGKLIDQFRETKRKLDALPTAEKTAQAIREAQEKLEDAQARMEMAKAAGARVSGAGGETAGGTSQTESAAAAGSTTADSEAAGSETAGDSSPLGQPSKTLLSAERPDAADLREPASPESPLGQASQVRRGLGSEGAGEGAGEDEDDTAAAPGLKSPQKNKRYVTMSPEFIAKDNLDKVRALAAYARKARAWEEYAGLGVLGSLAAAAIWSSRGALVAGTTTAIGLAGRMLWKSLLNNEAVIKTLAKPTIEQYRQVMALPEHQRPGVEEAMAQLEAEAQKRKLIPADRSPWRNFADTVGVLGVGQPQAARGRALTGQAGAGGPAGPAGQAGSGQSNQQLLEDMNKALAGAQQQ